MIGIKEEVTVQSQKAGRTGSAFALEVCQIHNQLSLFLGLATTLLHESAETLAMQGVLNKPSNCKSLAT
jgi:hypothetical protein